MNQGELIDAIESDAGITKTQAERALKSLTKHVAAALAAGESVKLTGFGTFTTAIREPMAGRNPRTGEPITTERRAQVKFKAGIDTRAAVKRLVDQAQRKAA